MKQRGILEKIQAFTDTLERGDFYDFYGLVTSMSNPLCGDVIWVEKKRYNLKRIVRLIRITVMYPRFNVDYGQRYTLETAEKELKNLLELRYKIRNETVEAKSVDKLIEALHIIIYSLGEPQDVIDFKGIKGIPVVVKP